MAFSKVGLQRDQDRLTKDWGVNFEKTDSSA